MNKISLFAAGATVSLLLPLSALAAESGELHILPTGAVSAKSVVVTQISGMNLFTRVQWGDTFIRLTVLLKKETPVLRKYGGNASAADIREGDLLAVEGKLIDGSGNLIIQATKVTDFHLTTEAKEVSGTVTAVDAGKGVLSVSTKALGAIRVAFPTDVQIKKGMRTIPLGEVVVGDKLLTASGTFDHPTKTLNAASGEIYQDKKVFALRLFQGTITALGGTSLPTTFTLSAEGTTYTVYLSQSTEVVNKGGTPIALSRLAAGDKVRLNGRIREANLKEVDATFVRDLAF